MLKEKYLKFIAVICISLLPAMAFSIDVEDDIADYQYQYQDNGATTPQAEVYDPLEPLNRAIYDFNAFADMLIIRNVSTAYDFFLAPPVRNRVGCALNNLGEPVNFANSLLQGRPDKALTAFWRFAINSTAGVLGLFDVAQYFGLPYNKEDFGQTLAVYGVGHGPYLVLPILGPSSLRDATGRVADYFIDPFTYTMEDEFAYSRTIVNGVHLRSASKELIDEVYRVSLDPYATFRSLYIQNRLSVVNE